MANSPEDASQVDVDPIVLKSGKRSGVPKSPEDASQVDVDPNVLKSRERDRGGQLT